MTLVCIECQKPYDANRGRKSDFCAPACKAAFHNRRARRGAILYDAMVLQRAGLDGTTFDPVRWGKRIDKMVAGWVAEDLAAGRKRTTLRVHDASYSLPSLDAE